jgi:hypothetical protein
MHGSRTIHDIDADIRCERAILAFEQRSGEHTTAVVDTRARLDALLDERLSMVVPHSRRTPPDSLHGDVV